MSPSLGTFLAKQESTAPGRGNDRLRRCDFAAQNHREGTAPLPYNEHTIKLKFDSKQTLKGNA
jgi:hypothetical protein